MHDSLTLLYGEKLHLKPKVKCDLAINLGFLCNKNTSVAILCVFFV